VGQKWEKGQIASSSANKMEKEQRAHHRLINIIKWRNGSIEDWGKLQITTLTDAYAYKFNFKYSINVKWSLI
jgi:hypothetical protein